MHRWTLLMTAFVCATHATNRCVHFTGRLRCVNRGVDGVRGAAVALWDKDSVSPFSVFDPDDRMGVTNAEADGQFVVRGCAHDQEWLGPLVVNEPEPYLRIYHYCHSDAGEESVYRRDNPIEIWEPVVHDLGTIQLDDLEKY